MTNDKIKEKVIQQIEKICGDTADGDTKLENIMDSLDVVELTMEMERDFDISIPDERAEAFSQQTVDQVVKDILSLWEEQRQ